MSINRDNYEEYFLLYADDELADTDKIELLKFLRDHKDLEEEFRLIQATISKPEKIANFDKSFLIRETTAAFINKDNCEEIFVLYHDKELDESQQRQVEDFIAVHREMEKELSNINRARLIPELSITFPGKADLYRTKTIVRRIPAGYWRALAAAVFIGFGFWIVQDYVIGGKEISPRVTGNQYEQPSSILLPQDTKTEVPETSDDRHSGSKTTVAVKSQKEKNTLLQKSLEKKKSPEIARGSITENLTRNQDSLSGIITSPLENLASINKLKDQQLPKMKTDRPVSVISADIAYEKESADVNGQQDDVAPEKDISRASYASLSESKNENYVFYNVTTQEFNKSKVGGFLKKVKRIVERNNPISRLLSGDEAQVVSN